MLMAALGLAAGFLATLAALAVRRPLVATLGAGYTGRFLLVQAIAINAVLYYVVRSAAAWVELPGGAGNPWLPVAYGLLFFLYSLSNIDWTARKFHDVQG
jgi:hypothetical protein